MSEPGVKPNEPRAAIDDLVRIQQRSVRRYGKYAVRTLERIQRGDATPGAWIDDYRGLLRETADDVRDAVTALVRLGGGKIG